MATDDNAERLAAAEPSSSPVVSNGRHRSAKPGKASKPRRAAKPPKSPRAAKLPAKPPRDAQELASAEAEAEVEGLGSAPARRRSRVRPIVLPAVAVVTVGAFVAALILTLSGGSKHQDAPLNKETRAAMSAANKASKDILGYDYRKIDSDINTAKREISGQLLTDYTTTAKKVLAQAGSTKSIVTATVSAQSIEHAQAGRVTVLLYVDQESVKQVAGAKTPNTRIDPLRIQMTMTKVHGHWLASDLRSV